MYSHPERSEGSHLYVNYKILRFAQNDTFIIRNFYLKVRACTENKSKCSYCFMSFPEAVLAASDRQ